MVKDIIMSHEAAMWEAARRCDSSAFLEVVSESAVMVWYAADPNAPVLTTPAS